MVFPKKTPLTQGRPDREIREPITQPTPTLKVTIYSKLNKLIQFLAKQRSLHLHDITHSGDWAHFTIGSRFTFGKQHEIFILLKFVMKTGLSHYSRFIIPFFVNVILLVYLRAEYSEKINITTNWIFVPFSQQAFYIIDLNNKKMLVFW